MSGNNFDFASVEAAEIYTEAMKPDEPETVEKPYTFRLLGAPDIFLMAKIISKIGINEFKACFEGDGIQSLIANAVASEKAKQEKGNASESNIISVGAGVVLELVNVILGNLEKCEAEIYQMLANTSNLTIKEIKAPGNAAMFLEMIIDFVKKDEFKDFIKVVSKLFK